MRSKARLNVVTFNHIPIAAGDHLVSVHIDSDKVDVDRVRLFRSKNNPFEWFPYVIGNGDVQAEASDVGAYMDLTPGNDGGAVRFDAPDVFHDAGTDYVMMAAGKELTHEVSASAATTLTTSLRHREDYEEDVEIPGDGMLALQVTLPPLPNGRSRS